MKRLLAALLVLVATVAYAQSFPKPPDVPSYITVTPTYAAGTTLNHLGNGIAPNGGTPPAQSYELTDIPSTESGWDITTDQSGSNFPLTTLNGGSGSEAKFRTQANATHIMFDDPIRNYGQPGTSHCHTFFGNGSANAYSTYASLRNKGRKYSAAAGGWKNSTGYWFPCVIIENAFGDGKNYVVKPNAVIIYYNHDPSEWNKIVRIPNGLRYVGGYNMDDGGGVRNQTAGTWLQGIIDTANAQPGTSGRYKIAPTGGHASVNYDYYCLATGQEVKSFRTAAGGDPFSPTCPATSKINIQFSGPTCWDGINLWSPGGYKHVIPEIWDTVEGGWVCPTGWYKIPKLQIQIEFTHEGFSGARGYGSWRLASDPITGSANTGTLHGRTLERGETFHTDWMDGWDGQTKTNWHNECLGMNGTPHECNFSVTSQFQRLIVNQTSPTGRSPQTTVFNFGTADPSKMWLLPTSSNGPKTIHVH